MADPVVHITNGIPDLGTGNITTLGQTLLDGANVTLGATTDVAASGAGTVNAHLRSIATSVAGTLTITGTVATSGTSTISGTVTANQGGSWTVQPGNTANTTAWLVTGTGGTFPVTGTVTANQGGAPWTMKPDGTLWTLTGTSANANITNASLNTNATQSGTWTVQPGNTANTTAWKVDGSAVTQPVSIAASVTTISTLTATSGNTFTYSRVQAAASTNATNLKASSGSVSSIDVFNVATYAVYLKLYNKASAPIVGSDTPVWTIPLPAGGGFSRPFNQGEFFSVGIAYAITKLVGDADTTAVAAGDVTGRIKWV